MFEAKAADVGKLSICALLFSVAKLVFFETLVAD